METLEKSLTNVKRDLEQHYTHLKDLMKSQTTTWLQKLELAETSRKPLGNLDALQRRLESIEDLFETQRKELFSTVSECERALGKRQEQVVKALKEVCSELKVEVP